MGRTFESCRGRFNLGSGIADLGCGLDDTEIPDPKSEIPNAKVMAAIVQRLERQIVVLDVEGSIPSSRPIPTKDTYPA